MSRERESKRKVSGWLSGALVVGALAALVWLEGRRPLRRETEPKAERDARNLAVAGLGAAALALTERPLAARLTALVERRRWGLLQAARMPAWLEVLLASVLLDYTLYLWHVLTHRVPWLWRFHRMHHADLDLSATTALRFHFAELVLSVPWRSAQIVALGVSPRAFSAWQTALFLSVMFHHSNVRLPESLERRLGALVVTPRMHGIHHSTVREERDSNWSSGLALWDRLHGTLRLDVPQDEIEIGVTEYRDPEQVGLLSILKLPFEQEATDLRLEA
ncbi:MAG TPA: sterol desaturase family protein [Pyrinomonadaceae bacterium]|nr:sterol desaturase family protein [Pyrinomonadaceae bacterium]